MRIWDKSRPPSGPFVLNQDCPQAQGLVAWWFGPWGARYIPDLAGRAHLTGANGPGVTIGPHGEPLSTYVQASSQYFSALVAPVSSMPLSMAARCVPDSSIQTVISMHNSADTDSFYRIVLVSGKVRANIGRDDGTQANAITTASYVAGAMNLVGADFISATSRMVYLEGRNAVSDTTNISPSAVDSVALGKPSTLSQFMNGQIGEAMVWGRVAGADIHARLADQALRFELCYPLRSRKWISLSSGTVYDVDLSESASASDSYSATTTLTAALSEAASATDSTTNTLTLAAALTEAASASDAFDASGSTYNLALAEGASAADAVAAVLVLACTLSEASSATDTVSAVHTVQESLSEAANAADAVAAVLLIGESLSEAASATDLVNWGGALYTVALDESASANDSIAASAALVAALTEIATAADSVAAGLVATGALAEAANAADALDALAVLLATVSEAGNATDTISAQGSQVYDVALGEAAAATDAWIGSLPASVRAAISAFRRQLGAGGSGRPAQVGGRRPRQ